MREAGLESHPTSLSELATPSQYAAFHGLTLKAMYKLIRAERLKVVNISPGVRPTYRLTLEQFPSALSPEDASEDVEAEAASARIAEKLERLRSQRTQSQASA